MKTNQKNIALVLALVSFALLLAMPTLAQETRYWVPLPNEIPTWPQTSAAEQPEPLIVSDSWVPLPGQNLSWEEKQRMYDRRQICSIWDEYCRSVRENDGQAFLALHELDAYKMPPGRPMFRIRDVAPTLQVNWNKTRQQMQIDMSIDCRDIVIAGDYAWSMGTYEQIFTPNNGAPQSTFNGKFLTVLRRQPNGSWKICRDCFNSDEAPSI